MKYQLSFVQTLWISLLSLASITSCTKTEYTDYEQQSANRISEFKITNSPQQLLGAINNEYNTIHIYIPYYLGLEYLVPAIKLDAGAMLIDADGNEINLDGGIEPIYIGDTTLYRIKGADDKIRTYTLTQQFLPISEKLVAGYTNATTDTDPITKSATDQFYVYGNFASTNTFSKFIFTDKSSGKQYDNFTKTLSVAPSAAYYTMSSQLLPEAIAGNYRVEIEHQGRRAKLPDMTIQYTRPFPTFFSSSANYAIGDTISFTPSTFGMSSGQGVYLDVDRVYLTIRQEATVPAGFDATLYNKEIAFPVVSQNRREVKVIVPEIPTGIYGSKSDAMTFYFDYKDASYGKAVRTGVLSTAFEIKPKN